MKEAPNHMCTCAPQDVAVGKAGAVGVDECAPYPASLPEFLYGAYGATKAEAERLVLGANGRVLKTASVRPTSVCVPGLA